MEGNLFPHMKRSPFFNTQHSPLGAFASFTLGARGAKGGFGLELGRPADHSVYIALESAEIPGRFEALPFYEDIEDESLRFDVEGEGTQARVELARFDDEAIERTLTPVRDEWAAGDLRFVIHTPAGSAPDPATASPEALALAYAPALAVELTLDNSRGSAPRRFIFGFQANDLTRGVRRLDETAPLAGIGCGSWLGIATRAEGVWSALGFTPEGILSETLESNRTFGIGNVALLVGSVPAGERITIPLAVAFFRGGIVTTGLEASYFYTRFFRNLEAVALYALDSFGALRARGEAFGQEVACGGLNPSRHFMLSQAVQSYYGSTELLDADGVPFWVVNEGEYRMMNTFDLTADQLYFELRLNPWTVRNELDWFVRRYSYTDSVYLPGDPAPHPGGLSFTHDMGNLNHFTRPGHSVYEKEGIHGCFSHMTHEELVNWLFCALAYEHRTRDEAWLRETLTVFHQTFGSLVNRDHPDPALRDGVMSADSSRCQGGSEITTYDSLDISLGQARNNLYLAVKGWGVYVGLAALFTRLGDTGRAEEAREQAARAARTIAASANGEGLLPAVLHENVSSRIIPAIEGLALPLELGLEAALSPDGEYGGLIRALRTHLHGVLREGVCLFADGGWKISSTSDNSWLSKIYLCQHVAERVLGGVDPEAMARADQAHEGWLRAPGNHYWAWSDQIVAGEARGSKYYPRGVTSILWLDR